MKLYSRSKNYVTVAASLLIVAGLPSVLAAQGTDTAVKSAEAQQQHIWRQTMREIPTFDTGCFHASYPSTNWEKVECAEAPGYRSVLPTYAGRVQTTGNGHDYVVQAPAGHFFSYAVGEFPAVSDVKSEKGANVPFGGGESNGVTGPNEYTLQVNTNFAYTSACDGYKGCLAWQQYVMATNAFSSLTSGKLTGKTEVFIEYWLINYGIDNGTNICPPTFIDAGPSGEGGDNCVQNSPATVVYNGQLPITDLAKVEFEGTAVKNGTDEAIVFYNKDAYVASTKDSYTDISSEWNQAEFNVVGNAGGSRADFNTGAGLDVAIVVSDGSTAAPTCISPTKNKGTTGETNNLNLGACVAEGGSLTYIEFAESN